MLKLFLLFSILMIWSCERDHVIVKFMFNDVGHIVFPLSINDSLVYGIFDTGAQSSLIEKKEQNRIGLDTSAKKVYSFFLTRERIRFYFKNLSKLLYQFATCN